jgi:predicted CoA-binding protein
MSHLERQKLHAVVFQDAWKRFTRDLRRCEMLSENQRRVEYVRVTERHQSGFIHFHVLVTQFLPVETIRYMWRVSVSRALASNGVQHTGYVGNVNVEGTTNNHERAAKYVTKYLSKSIADCQNLELRKRWVKSAGASIFEKTEKTGDYVLIRFSVHGNMFAPFNPELNEQLLLAQKTHPELPKNADFDLLNLSQISISAQNQFQTIPLSLFELEMERTATNPPPNYSNIGLPIDDFDWIWESFGE